MNSLLKTTPALRGTGVLVTRPAHQADKLCRLIEAQGGTTIRFPVIEILGPRDPQALLTAIDRLDEYDIAIFVSANAVSGTLPLIQDRRDWPAHVKRVAIGRGSARMLERFGLPAHLLPEHTFNSESLLDLPQMQAVAGLRIIIFRGENGRELLADTLRERGAQVTYVAAYRRSAPQVDPGGLLQHWQQGEIQIVVITSNEGLQNLFDIVGELGQQWLYDTPLIVVSRRTQRRARELGFSHTPLLAGEASDEAIVEALITWHQARFK